MDALQEMIRKLRSATRQDAGKHTQLIVLPGEAQAILDILDCKTADFQKPKHLTAIVVIEGEKGDGNVLRVILTPEVPSELESLAEYGSQVAKEINPDFCATDEEVVAIFDEMNPPADDADEDDAEEDEE